VWPCTMCSTTKKETCLCRMGEFIINFFVLNCYYFIMGLIKLGPYYIGAFLNYLFIIIRGLKF
jgi:hypothetical protein